MQLHSFTGAILGTPITPHLAHVSAFLVFEGIATNNIRAGAVLLLSLSEGALEWFLFESLNETSYSSAAIALSQKYHNSRMLCWRSWGLQNRTLVLYRSGRDHEMVVDRLETILRANLVDNLKLERFISSFKPFSIYDMLKNEQDFDEVVRLAFQWESSELDRAAKGTRPRKDSIYRNSTASHSNETAPLQTSSQTSLNASGTVQVSKLLLGRQRPQSEIIKSSQISDEIFDLLITPIEQKNEGNFYRTSDSIPDLPTRPIRSAQRPSFSSHSIDSQKSFESTARPKLSIETNWTDENSAELDPLPELVKNFRKSSLSRKKSLANVKNRVYRAPTVKKATGFKRMSGMVFGIKAQTVERVDIRGKKVIGYESGSGSDYESK